MKITQKIIITLFLTVLIALPFMASSCNSTSSSRYIFQKAPMCHVASLTQAEPHNLTHLRQLTLGILSSSNYSVRLIELLTVVMAVGLFSLVFRWFALPRNLLRTQTNMKPWDPLRLAFARGIIQRKLLD